MWNVDRQENVDREFVNIKKYSVKKRFPEGRANSLIEIRIFVECEFHFQLIACDSEGGAQISRSGSRHRSRVIKPARDTKSK